MIKAVDIIFGLAWGDEGKGKISNAIAKNYDTVRYRDWETDRKSTRLNSSHRL